jgi:rubrerythrin
VDKPPVKLVVTPIVSALKSAPPAASPDAVKCERCGAEMYRMHAVWRCPACRFKTDCCGW